jgi:hypothetical protein
MDDSRCHAELGGQTDIAAALTQSFARVDAATFAGQKRRDAERMRGSI